MEPEFVESGSAALQFFFGGSPSNSGLPDSLFQDFSVCSEPSVPRFESRTAGRERLSCCGVADVFRPWGRYCQVLNRGEFGGEGSVGATRGSVDVAGRGEQSPSLPTNHHFSILFKLRSTNITLVVGKLCLHFVTVGVFGWDDGSFWFELFGKGSRTATAVIVGRLPRGQSGNRGPVSPRLGRYGSHTNTPLRKLAAVNRSASSVSTPFEFHLNYESAHQEFLPKILNVSLARPAIREAPRRTSDSRVRHGRLFPLLLGARLFC